MDIITLASTICGLTGYAMKDVFKQLSRRGVPIKLIATANIRLLAMLTEKDDELSGRWYISKWRSFWKASQETKWQETPYHANGYLYVLYRYPNEQRWKATLILNYTWQRGRMVPLSKSIQAIFDRWFGKSFKGVYDVEIRKVSEDKYVGATTMIYRIPNLATRYSGLIEDLTIQSDGIFEGKFRNIDRLPEPMVDAKAEFAFQQRHTWSEIEVEN